MKKITIVLAMLLSYVSFSQENKVTCLDLSNSGQLYIGMKNCVQYTFPKYNQKNITVVSQDSCARVTKIDDYGNYKISVFKPGECIIKVYYNNTKLLGEYKYTKSWIPSPEAKIGGKYGGVIRKSTLMLQQGIIVTFNNPLLDSYIGYKVVGYEVSVRDKTISVQGNRFTPEVKELIKNISGSRIIFTNIRAKNPWGYSQKLNDIVFKLK